MVGVVTVVVGSMVFTIAVKLGLFFPTHITLFISIEYHLPFYHQLLTSTKPICNVSYSA